MLRDGRLRIAIIAAALSATACAEPTAPGDGAAAPGASVTTSIHIPASVEWNGMARDLVVAHPLNPFAVTRFMAMLGIAQHNAVVAADELWPVSRPSARAAAAAASALVLGEAFPVAIDRIEDLLEQQLTTAGWIEDGGADVASAVEIGRAAARAVLAYAATDRFFAPWNGVVPVGPGLWFSSATPPAPPIGANIGNARPWLLRSGDQFRPPPPPAFGSEEFLQALAEVRTISDTRTPEQDALARFWNGPPGTVTPPGYWNEVAAGLVVRYRLNERRASHLFAVLNAAGLDAFIACHDAKFTYWLIRPTQVDPGITLSIPLPNFPSYPSNHACLSSTMTEIIADAFPSQRRYLRAQAEEAAISRVWGGIHYRFDGDAGLEIGRRIARYVRGLGLKPQNPFPLGL